MSDNLKGKHLYAHPADRTGRLNGGRASNVPTTDNPPFGCCHYSAAPPTLSHPSFFMHKAASSAPEASRCDRGADVSSVIRATMQIRLDIRREVIARCLQGPDPDAISTAPGPRSRIAFASNCQVQAAQAYAAPAYIKRLNAAWDLDYLRTVLATQFELDATALFVNVHPIDNHCNIVI